MLAELSQLPQQSFSNPRQTVTRASTLEHVGGVAEFGSLSSSHRVPRVVRISVTKSLTRSGLISICIEESSLIVNAGVTGTGHFTTPASGTMSGLPMASRSILQMPTLRKGKLWLTGGGTENRPTIRASLRPAIFTVGHIATRVISGDMQCTAIPAYNPLRASIAIYDRGAIF